MKRFLFTTLLLITTATVFAQSIYPIEADIIRMRKRVSGNTLVDIIGGLQTTLPIRPGSDTVTSKHGLAIVGGDTWLGNGSFYVKLQKFQTNYSTTFALSNDVVDSIRARAYKDGSNATGKWRNAANRADTLTGGWYDDGGYLVNQYNRGIFTPNWNFDEYGNGTIRTLTTNSFYVSGQYGLGYGRFRFQDGTPASTSGSSNLYAGADGRFKYLNGASTTVYDLMTDADTLGMLASYQTAISGKVSLTGNETIAGIKSFTSYTRFLDSMVLPVVGNTGFTNRITSRTSSGDSRLFFESAITSGGNGARFAFNTTDATKNVGVDWMISDVTTFAISNRSSDLTNSLKSSSTYKIAIGSNSNIRELVAYPDGRFSIGTAFNYPSRTAVFTNDFTTLLGDTLYMSAPILPTTDNARALGNASFRWADLRSIRGTFSTGVSINEASPIAPLEIKTAGSSTLENVMLLRHGRGNANDALKIIFSPRGAQINTGWASIQATGRSSSTADLSFSTSTVSSETERLVILGASGNTIINNGYTDINTTYKLQVTGIAYATKIIQGTSVDAGFSGFDFLGNGRMQGSVNLSGITSGATTDSILVWNASTKNVGYKSIVVPTNTTYTPTLTNTLNVTTSSLTEANYSRISNRIYVSAVVTITPTTNGSTTQLTFTLPINSSLSAGGNGTIIGSRANAEAGFVQLASTSTYTATFVATGNTSSSYYINFNYSL